MSGFYDGIRISLRAGYELHYRWSEFWRAVQPWGWVQIGFSVLDATVYPDGNPSRLMGFLWLLLYAGLTVIMAWNWQNALAGRARRLDWREGWEDPDLGRYAGLMIMAMFVLPILASLAVSLPLAFIVAIVETIAGPLGALVKLLAMILVMAAFFYISARLAVLSAVLMTPASPPLMVAWGITARRWQVPMGGIAVLFICVLTAQVIILALANFLEGFGLTSALWILPVSISVSFFFLGWLVLLGQRLYETLR